MPLANTFRRNFYCTIPTNGVILHSPKMLFMRFCRCLMVLSILMWLPDRTSAGISRLAAPFQQKEENIGFKGRLLDSRQEPVSGARIVAGNGASVVSDRSGFFLLNAMPGDSIIITKRGYVETSYRLTTLKEFSLEFNAVAPSVAPPVQRDVQFVHHTMPADLSLASTSTVYSKDIIKSPVTSVRNALTGRMAGLFTLQSSGNPGQDGVSASLRGQNPLIIIDGIPRNLTIFDLEEIESVTAIKDALGTAMLGSRGSNGALLITTKKGTVSKQRISFTAQTAFQKPVDMPKALNSYDYARLYNEALANDGNSPIYSDEALEKYRSGSDPNLFPNVDWRKQALKKSSRFDRYTLNAQGGNNTARYYVSLEHINQTGLLQTVDSNKYNTNNTFKSYVARSNVDINITKNLSAGVYLLGRILNGNEPGATTSSLFNSFLNTPNNAYPVLNPNGSYGGNSQYTNNIWAQTIGSGYRENYKRDMLADFYLQRTLDDITPGLYVRAAASFYSTLSENINRSKPYRVFNMQVSPTGDTTYQQFGNIGDQANSNSIEYQGRSDYMELKFGYNRTFGVHGVDATLLANRLNSVDNSDLPFTSPGVSGRFAYNFNKKYLAEVAFGMNGSNRYPPDGDYKMGFFPAIGLGWNIAEEGFMKESKVFSRLKLFGSYGKTGWDRPGNFVYVQRYFDGAATYFGTGAGSNTSINEQILANPNITFEAANKLNLGISGGLLNERLSFTAEYYNNKYYDLLMQRGRNSSIIGNFYPDENIGENRYSGVELQLDWQDAVKDFSYFVSANAALQKTEVLYIDEVFRPYPWMSRTGNVIGQQYGYIADGFFQQNDDFINTPTIDGYTPQAGDIKYRDLNDDGVINQFDQAPIYTDKPMFIYGISAGFAWKGFDLSLLLQGVQNRDIYLSGNGYWEFQNNGFGQAYEHHLNRWTPATAATASYPRLGIGTNPNNQAFSSFWVRNGSYARLKNVEVGYTLPSAVTRVVKLQSARFFVSGLNLLTFSSLDGVDPEVYNGAYPLQKLVNIGLNIKL